MPHHISSVFTLLALMLTAAFASCGKADKPAEQIASKAPAYDTAAVHLALVPSADCLPFIYAEETGIYRKLGLRLQLHTYASQLDCDTALLGGYMDGGYADSQRLAQSRFAKAAFTRISQGKDTWQLFISGTLRVKDIAKLSGRIVGIARESSDKSFCEALITQAHVKADDIYLTQINDVKLRSSMITNRQIDAAVLRWPFTSLSLAAGNKLLVSQPSTAVNNIFVQNNRARRPHLGKSELELLRKGYLMACDSIQTIRNATAKDDLQTDKVSALLQKVYALDAAVADTIKIPTGGFFREKTGKRPLPNGTDKP